MKEFYRLSNFKIFKYTCKSIKIHFFIKYFFNRLLNTYFKDFKIFLKYKLNTFRF